MSEAAGRLDLGSSADVAVRNRKLEQLINPENNLPEVDAYPILGGTFSNEDLRNKYPEEALLPLQEALSTGRGVSLILGYRDRMAADMRLQPVDGTRLWQVVDTWVHGGDWLVPPEQSLRGLGLGKRLFLELFKRLPPGTEVTHNELTPDGKRMWAWLAEKGIAVKPTGDLDGASGEYVTRINELTQGQDSI